MLIVRYASDDMKPEAVVQQEIRLAAPGRGIYLWRNNNGAFYAESGQLVRYGLANESKKENEKFKSHDLIGLTQYVVRPEDVGKKIAIFTSLECKPEGWHYTATKREVGQLNWLALVRSLGGISKFLPSVQEL